MTLSTKPMLETARGKSEPLFTHRGIRCFFSEKSWDGWRLIDGQGYHGYAPSRRLEVVAGVWKGATAEAVRRAIDCWIGEAK
jgi:hypothetical protein